MKLLVAYDGSGCAEAAIDDLYQAGLPETGTAHVISVAEVWLPPPDSINDPSDAGPVFIENIVRAYREEGERILAEHGQPRDRDPRSGRRFVMTCPLNPDTIWQSTGRRLVIRNAGLGRETGLQTVKASGPSTRTFRARPSFSNSQA